MPVRIEYIPETHPEYDEAIRAVRALKTSPSLDPMVLPFITTRVEPAGTLYQGKRAAYVTANANWKSAVAVLRKVESNFIPFYRRFIRSVTDGEGKVPHAALANIMGVSRPSDIESLSGSEMVTRVGLLVTQLPLRTDLESSPEAITKLAAHLLTLSAAVEARDKAETVRLLAGQEQHAAEAALVKEYTQFLAMYSGIAGRATVKATLPGFTRGAGAARSDDDDDVDSELRDIEVPEDEDDT